MSHIIAGGLFFHYKPEGRNHEDWLLEISTQLAKHLQIKSSECSRRSMSGSDYRKPE
jgi:hypothetical protein